MSAVAPVQTITIRIKMLSGDILPVSVPVDAPCYKVHRLVCDALPFEECDRPWSIGQISLFSLREEEKERIPQGDEPFQAEEDEQFLIMILPNRYEAWVQHVQSDTNFDERMTYSLYRFGVDTSTGRRLMCHQFYLREDGYCAYARDIIHAGGQYVRFADYARVYRPRDLIRDYISTTTAFFPETADDLVDRLVASFEYEQLVAAGMPVSEEEDYDSDN